MGTVRYEERGQWYCEVENVGKHWSNVMFMMCEVALRYCCTRLRGGCKWRRLHCSCEVNCSDGVNGK
jgi:hypothetical protein